MRIETVRLIIRSFEGRDTEALEQIKYDPQVLKFVPDFIDRDEDSEGMTEAIWNFRKLEEEGNLETWRCYAIELKETGEVVGCLSFGKSEMLHEYELGWMMKSSHAGNGYASEAAVAFAEDFCRSNEVDYLIAVMDTDNTASFRTAEKSGFKLFERRTVYDWHYGRYADDYYYFRRYWSCCRLKQRFYGDVPYEGRGAREEDT